MYPWQEEIVHRLVEGQPMVVHMQRLSGRAQIMEQASRMLADWPEHRARFCRDLNPEQFLAELRRIGWSDQMIVDLELETRLHMLAEPDVPIMEHLLDAAITVRYPKQDE